MYKYKILAYIIICFFCTSIIRGQEKDLEKSIHELKQKINATEKTDKLKLLDSLYKLTRFKSEFNYDSIAKTTVDYLFSIDSIRLAIKFTEDRIFYHTNRANNPKEGILILENYEKRGLEITNLNTSALKELSDLYRNAGDAYYFSGSIKASIPIYDKSENIALMSKDSSRYAKSRTFKASSYADLGDYAIASQLLTETSQIFRTAKDSIRLNNAQSALSSLYSRMGFYKEAKKISNEVIKRSKFMHSYHLNASHNTLIPMLINAAIDEKKNHNKKLRIILLEEALEHSREPKNETRHEPLVLYHLLSAYAETGRIIKAKELFNKIQESYAKQEPIPYLIEYGTALVDYFIAVKDFKGALIIAKKTLIKQEEASSVDSIYETNEKLAIIYKALNNIEESYKHYVDFVTLRDSINSVKKGQALSYYQTLYETEKRDFKISEQESEITVLDQQNKIKNQWLLFGGLGLLFGFAIIYLFRSRNFSRKEKEHQELFSQELIKTQEEQRTKVARDLHDSVGQKLMLLTKKVKSFKDSDVDDLAKTTLEELRGISRGLYPATFERLGITASIQSMINEVDANTNLFFTIEMDNIDDTLSRPNALHLYRIIQEVLNNVVKHANAKSVSISIAKRENTIETIIKDNGIGFEFTEKLDSNTSLGMKTLLERAKIIKSKFLINSGKDKGTTMQLITPFSL